MDTALAARRKQRVIDLSLVSAMFNLAVLTKTGKGVPLNKKATGEFF
jgi:hypothetical protein